MRYSFRINTSAICNSGYEALQIKNDLEQAVQRYSIGSWVWGETATDGSSIECQIVLRDAESLKRMNDILHQKGLLNVTTNELRE